jgi:hypothetical protein
MVCPRIGSVFVLSLFGMTRRRRIFEKKGGKVTRESPPTDLLLNLEL